MSYKLVYQYQGQTHAFPLAGGKDDRQHLPSVNHAHPKGLARCAFS